MQYVRAFLRGLLCGLTLGLIRAHSKRAARAEEQAQDIALAAIARAKASSLRSIHPESH